MRSLWLLVLSVFLNTSCNPPKPFSEELKDFFRVQFNLTYNQNPDILLGCLLKPVDGGSPLVCTQESNTGTITATYEPAGSLTFSKNETFLTGISVLMPGLAEILSTACIQEAGTEVTISLSSFKQAALSQDTYLGLRKSRKPDCLSSIIETQKDGLQVTYVNTVLVGSLRIEMGANDVISQTCIEALRKNIQGIKTGTNRGTLEFAEKVLAYYPAKEP